MSDSFQVLSDEHEFLLAYLYHVMFFVGRKVKNCVESGGSCFESSSVTFIYRSQIKEEQRKCIGDELRHLQRSKRLVSKGTLLPPRLWSETLKFAIS